ncbi:hypothetical protein [Deefgea sp. CFH1-16]|uniref:hypothetical protein n=1 Tax=Deefgea sp. CFH1-16 TaxID=2675457 RepID=UPI0015F70211|nr:hypothetical protein [Deefgea sp. CFH1-16]MBM5575786.1 hypothetical protein [Deefgea sp. CFH1-16]
MNVTPVFCHLEDLGIVRPNGEAGHTAPFAKLYECDGGYLGSFPDSWTDEQIHTALKFANIAYAKGHEAGQLTKASEIRAVLGISQSVTN